MLILAVGNLSLAGHHAYNTLGETLKLTKSKGDNQTVKMKSNEEIKKIWILFQYSKSIQSHYFP